MAKRFQKKCVCHGTPALVVKKQWKAMKRVGAEPCCMESLLESKVIFTPYIPLLTPIAIKP